MKCSECGALSLTEEIEVVPQASVVLVDTEKKKRLPALMLLQPLQLLCHMPILNQEEKIFIFLIMER